MAAAQSQKTIENAGIGYSAPVPEVCLVTPFPPPFGGIARWAEIITLHAAHTCQVDLHPVDISPRWRNIHDLRIWLRWGLGSAHGVILLVRVLYKLVLGSQVLHLTTSGQLAIHRDIAMMRLAKVFDVPVVYHLHFGRIPELAMSNTPEWRLLVKAFRMSKVIIPIDQRTEDTLKAHLPELDLRLIPNCADIASLPVPSTRPGTPLTLLYLGWVVPAKGIYELLQAWGGLDVSGWRLVIAGPFEEAFRRELAYHHSMRGVEFTGALSHEDSMSLMATADVFVLPSHTEGFPNVIVEAMALSRPIVATSVGAIPEMLQGGCALVVPPRDSTSLKTALQCLMTDERLRARLGRTARERLQKYYTVDSVFARLLALWQELVT